MSNESLIVSLVSDDERELTEYLEFLDAADYVHLVQSPQWPEIKKGWSAKRFIARDGAAVVGVAQALYVTDSETGTGFAYIPRGPVTDDDEVAKALVAAVYESAKDSGCTTLRVDPPWLASEDREVALADLARSLPGGVENTASERLKGQPKLNMILDISDYDVDSWFSSISKNRRKNIRRSANHGVVTEIRRGRENVERLYELIEETCERQGISHRPKQYFYDLCDVYGDDCFFAIAMYEGKISSISINVVYHDVVYNLYAGNDVSDPSLQIPSAQSAEMVREGFRVGAKKVDFGGVFGTDREDHLYFFKIGYFPSGQDVTVFAGEIDYAISK